MQEKDVKLRGEVVKQLPKFEHWLRQHGAKVIWELLTKGESGAYRLTILRNKKDRHQMLQLLDLQDYKP